MEAFRSVRMPIDVNLLVNPCILQVQDQCRCLSEEENPSVTAIILKHGKTYDSCPQLLVHFKF